MIKMKIFNKMNKVIQINNKILNMIGSSVMIAEKLFKSNRLIINAKNVKTICFVINVMSLLSINILYLKEKFQKDLVHQNLLLHRKFYQSSSHVKHVEESYQKLSNITNIEIDLKMCNFCVKNAMMKVDLI